MFKLEPTAYELDKDTFYPVIKVTRLSPAGLGHTTVLHISWPYSVQSSAQAYAESAVDILYTGIMGLLSRAEWIDGESDDTAQPLEVT